MTRGPSYGECDVKRTHDSTDNFKVHCIEWRNIQTHDDDTIIKEKDDPIMKVRAFSSLLYKK